MYGYSFLLQLVVGIILFGYYYSNYCCKVTLLAAASMAQVSEFSFVLASRARRLRILSREVRIFISIIMLALSLYFHHNFLLNSACLSTLQHETTFAPSTLSIFFNFSVQVYLVIVSVTALSIILSPALWRRPCRMAAARLRRLSTRESSSQAQ